ncbi:MAG: BLUF domain-containing protein [Burkholderiales bacterium]|nr:BLUF domain-containing protein [Burkholderiales bacterium]
MGDMVKVYRSRARAGLVDADINQLLQVSRRNNPLVRIDGMLLFGRGCFVQLIEGPGPAVERTYRRILSDPRHADAVLLYDGAGEPRRFTGWAMGFARMEPYAHLASVDHFLRLAETDVVSAFRAEVALGLLLDFRRECACSDAAAATC